MIQKKDVPPPQKKDVLIDKDILTETKGTKEKR